MSLFNFKTRIIFTLLVFILPLPLIPKIMLMFVADSLDCKDSDYCGTFDYQLKDKLLDIATYLLVLYVVKPEEISFYIFLIMWRIVGIIGFLLTKSVFWLIICPDVFKEILLYQILLNRFVNTEIAILIVGKVAFEYYWHTIHIHHTN